MRVYLFVLLLLFFPGVIVSTQWSENLARGLILTEMKSSSAILSDQKNWRAPRPPPTLNILPKSSDQNSEIAILFNIVEKPYNHVFWDDLLPQSLHGRGFKLQTLSLCLQCLHIAMVIEKCTDIFRGKF